MKKIPGLEKRDSKLHPYSYRGLLIAKNPDKRSGVLRWAFYAPAFSAGDIFYGDYKVRDASLEGIVKKIDLYCSDRDALKANARVGG